MKVALIRCGAPAAPNALINPPLGLMYLASTLRRANHDPILFDLKITPQLNRLERELASFQPDVFGLSAFSPDAIDLANVAAWLKQRFPGMPIVAGGPHATSNPDDTLARGDIDFAVIGEGEATFVELLNRLDGDAAATPGVATRDGQVLRFAPTRPLLDDLDLLPYPAWDLIDIEAYAHFYGATPVGKGRYMPVFTSRGCPYRCTYCHRIFGKRFRKRSAENVIGEIIELRERFGINRIEICDDIFNAVPARAIAICNEIAEKAPGTRLSFPNGLRADVMTPEVLAAMKRAGAYLISYAVETATPRLQAMVKKHVNLEKARAVIARTAAEGIYTNGFFMLGFPSETEAEVRSTVDFACSTKLHSMSAYIFVPFPNSEIYDEIAASKPNLSLGSGFDYHTGAVNCSNVPTPKLHRLKRNMYLKFYFRSGRILRTLWAHPDKGSLPSLAWIMLKRLFSRRGMT